MIILIIWLETKGSQKLNFEEKVLYLWHHFADKCTLNIKGQSQYKVLRFE